MKTGPDLLQEFLKPGKAFEEPNLSLVVSVQTETSERADGLLLGSRGTGEWLRNYENKNHGERKKKSPKLDFQVQNTTY